MVSISGKKWLYKEYDSNYVNYLKENYSLDEITAKLLSIRNVEKNYIETFLKPSIKNLIPNPFGLKDMKKTANRILKAIQTNEKTLTKMFDIQNFTTLVTTGPKTFTCIQRGICIIYLFRHKIN